MPTPTANAIISTNVANELRKKGHQVTYIAVNQNIQPSGVDRECIHPVRSTSFGSVLTKKNEVGLSKGEKLMWLFLKIIRKIQNFIYIFKYPDVDPGQSQAVYKLAYKLHLEEKYDAVIGVFRPFSCVSAVVKMKKAFPGVAYGAHYLDIISQSKKPMFMPFFLFRKMLFQGEKKAFKHLDFVLLPESAKERYSSHDFSMYADRFEYCGFPSFIPMKGTGSKKPEASNGETQIVYAGILSSVYRNPEYIMRVLSEVSSRSPGISLHIYGRGDCGEILKHYASKIDMHLHGMVEQRVVMEAYSNADFVLNISNTDTEMVPSKIFELFSTGKPIINIVKNPEDPSTSFWDKYPSVCKVNEWEDIDLQTEKVENFITRERGAYYNPEAFSNEFIEYTPKFVAEVIERRIHHSGVCHE